MKKRMFYLLSLIVFSVLPLLSMLGVIPDSKRSFLYVVFLPLVFCCYGFFRHEITYKKILQWSITGLLVIMLLDMQLNTVLLYKLIATAVGGLIFALLFWLFENARNKN